MYRSESDQGLAKDTIGAKLIFLFLFVFGLYVSKYFYWYYTYMYIYIYMYINIYIYICIYIYTQTYIWKRMTSLRYLLIRSASKEMKTLKLHFS